MKTRKLFVALLTFIFVIAGIISFQSKGGKVHAADTSVVEDVMNVKCQITAGTDASTTSPVNMRLVASVDCLENYSEVGFEIYYNGTNDPSTATPIIAKTSTVYKRIVASATSGVDYNYSPKVISTDSEYFVTVTLININPTNFDKPFYIKPFCKMIDGETVYGVSRYVKVSDCYNNIINLPVKATEAQTTGMTVDYNTTKLTQVTGYDYDGTYTHLKFQVNDGQTLSSLTSFAVKDSEGKTIDIVTHRNLTTEYNGDGVGDTSWYTEALVADSTETEFVIATSADLYGLQSKSTSYNFASDKIYLVSDITINSGKATDWATTAPDSTMWWTPINSFAGAFDGQGHTISGLYGNSDAAMGLFTSTVDTTEITNLKVTNSYFETSGTAVGLSAISGAGRGSFKNIYANAILVGTGGSGQGLGAILGCADTTGTTTTNKGTVTIENCWSNCIINSNGQRVAGILGSANASNVNVNVKHCLNTGTITSTAASGYRFFGGIVGATGSATTQSGAFTMDDCLNIGTVTTASGCTNKAQGAVIGQVGGCLNITKTYALNTSTNNSLVIGNHASGFSGTKAISFKTFSDLQGSNVKTTDLDFDNYWSVVDGAVPELKTFAGTLWTDTTWFNTTTKGGTITTRSQLYGFTALAASGKFDSSSKVYLGADITVNKGIAADWGRTAPEHEWTPINAFAGKLDGQGHTISGLYGKSTTEMGLFKATAVTTEITNLKVTNSYFESSKVGLGTISSFGCGTFKNIYVDATLVGTGQQGSVGGILGYRSSSTLTIENCWSNCAITADGSKVGGILGGANANAAIVNIKHCLNTGTLTYKHISGTTYRLFGGIAGATGNSGATAGSSGFIMDDCLNVGTLTASATANNAQGGILGQAGGTPSITNTYYLNTSANKVIGNEESTYQKTNVDIESKTATELKGVNADTNTDLDFDNYWSPVYESSPVLTTFADDLDVLCVDTSWYDTTTKGGTITTRSQLYGFTALAASGKFDSSSKVYLGADITVNEGTTADWGTTTPKHEWTPISAFAGTFDGQGHTISGLYGKSTTAMGLFTATADSTVIQDLKVINSYFETSTHGLGTISGAGRGIFKNIYADATLVGTNQGQGVGGILGIAQATTVTIENCWSNCKINSDGKKVGGIIGSSNANLATVSIKHCLNTGTITYTGTYTDNYVRFFGGLIGATGNGTTGRFTMDDCLNVGTVTVANGCINNAQGAILGQAEGSPTITNTYALNTSSTKMVGNGTASVTSKTIQQLEGEQATKTTALDFVNYWTTVTGSTPVLQSFVREEYLSNIDKFTPSWDYDFPEEMMSYENKVAALNAVGEDARMISVFHMGGDIQHYPKNSIEALISAIQMGADVVEVDLVKTADGHIVLMHDETLSSYTDFANKNGVNGLPTDDDITKWTLDQLRQLRLKNLDGTISGYLIPTLEEALTVSNGRVKLVLDKIFISTLGVYTPVLNWETDIYPIIAKTGAWDTWILPYHYDVDTQIAIVNTLENGAGVDSLIIHAFVKFGGNASTTTENAQILRNEGITPIAYWHASLVTETMLTESEDVLSNLKTSIRIMGQNHALAGGIETSEMWDTLLNNGVNMVLTDKGYDLQQYIATKFYKTNQ